MADILINKFRTTIPRVGATPSTQGFAESEGQDPVAPSGTPQVYTPVTIGSPANGLDIDPSTQVLIIGLASTSTTGALSSTDWNTFNAKIGGSLTSGRVPFATGVNTLGDDAGLQWDNSTKVLTAIGQQVFQGTTATDTAPLGTELATTGSGTNWTGTSFATGYTHTVGSTAALTTSISAVIGTYYQIEYTITGRTAGSITINYGGTITSGITATGTTGPVATSTANLEIVPTTDFNGTVVLSLRSIGISSATTSIANSSGIPNAEIRASNITSNLFYGRGVGSRNTTGFNNIFFGVNCGRNNTTGSFNAAFGLSSFEFNTTGSGNSVFGANAGELITTGGSNSLFGRGAGGGMTSAILNSSFGTFSALNITTSSNGIFFGFNAGRFTSTGSNLTLANNSIFIGVDTRANANSETNQIVIGHNAIGGGSNTTTIGNSSTVSTRIPAGSLWIGTTSGTNTVDVNGTARIRTISNLGSAATSVLVPSATGVVSLRTLAELASDAGLTPLSGLTTNRFIKATSATTVGNTGVTEESATSYLFGNRTMSSTSTPLKVSFGATVGTNTPGNAGNLKWLLYDTGTDQYGIGMSNALMEFRAGNIGGFAFFPNNGVTSLSINSSGFVTIPNDKVLFVKDIRQGSGTASDVVEVKSSLSVIPFSGLAQLDMGSSFGSGTVGTGANTKLHVFKSGTTSYGFGVSAALLEVKVPANAAIAFFTNGESFRILNTKDIQLADAVNFILNATTGTKIGTATNQRLAFWNATPIVQPTGNILTALSNLGLVATPTLSSINLTEVEQDVSTSGSLNNVTLNSDTTIISFSAASTVTGLTGGTQGRKIYIRNESSSNITLSHESGSSTDVNRFFFYATVNFTLPIGAISQWIYLDSRWRVIGEIL